MAKTLADEFFVSNVWAITLRSIWGRYRTVTIIVMLGVAGILIIGWRLLNNGLGPAAYLSFFLFLIYIGFLITKARDEFMRQFAVANNFHYQLTAKLSSVSGRLFSLGHSRKIRRVVSGYFRETPMRLFHYYYSIGYGRSRRNYRFTVCELTFSEIVFPHILLQSRNMAKYSRHNWLETKDLHLPLEDEFQKTYHLFATQGYQIEVFQIFTPEVLYWLKNHGSHLSVEFAANCLYIYDNKLILRWRPLWEIFELSDWLAERLDGPLLSRLKDDFEVLHPYYLNRQPIHRSSAVSDKSQSR